MTMGLGTTLIASDALSMGADGALFCPHRKDSTVKGSMEEEYHQSDVHARAPPQDFYVKMMLHLYELHFRGGIIMK